MGNTTLAIARADNAGDVNAVRRLARGARLDANDGASQALGAEALHEVPDAILLHLAAGDALQRRHTAEADQAPGEEGLLGARRILRAAATPPHASAGPKKKHAIMSGVLCVIVFLKCLVLNGKRRLKFFFSTLMQII